MSIHGLKTHDMRSSFHSPFWSPFGHAFGAGDVHMISCGWWHTCKSAGEETWETGLGVYTTGSLQTWLKVFEILLIKGVSSIHLLGDSVINMFGWYQNQNIWYIPLWNYWCKPVQSIQQLPTTYIDYFRLLSQRICSPSKLSEVIFQQ